MSTLIGKIIGLVLIATTLAGCGTFFTAKPTAQDVSRAQQDITAATLATAIEKPAWVPEMVKVSAAVVSGVNAGKITTLGEVQLLINQEATGMHFSQKTVDDANAFMLLLTLYVQQHGQVSLNVPVQLCMVASWVNIALGGNADCAQQVVTSPTGT